MLPVKQDDHTGEQYSSIGHMSTVNALVSNIGSLLRKLLSSVTATILICLKNDKTEFTQTPKSMQDKTRDEGILFTK